MKKLALGLLATVLAVLLGEVAMRIFVPPPQEPVVPPDVVRFDERLGWGLRPLARAVSGRTGRPVEYAINSKGLRDEETPYAKPPGRYRIVLLGDSRAFGYGIPLSQHFSTLLEGYFRDLEVVNLGVTGYGVDQELLSYELEGRKYSPDLVIAYVAHYADHRHMHTVRFGMGKPRFRLEGGELLLENQPVPALHPERDRGALRRGARWLLSRSRVLRLLRDAAHRLLGPEPRPEPPSEDEERENVRGKKGYRPELVGRTGFEPVTSTV